MAKTKPATQTRIKFISKPEALVKAGEDLLASTDCIEVLGGLVLMTGLACDSLLEADNQIKEKTAYSVIFIQKKNSTEETREIPTLIKADKVVKAISFLRDSLDLSHLDSKTINSSYMQSVFKVWQQHFQKFLPLPPKSQFSHQTWRLIYAAIATHWYCPENVSAIDYKAYICGQGDLILDKAENIKEKIAAQLNYFEYQIEARKNKIDEAVGLKLSGGSVQVLEKFKPRESGENLAGVNQSELEAIGPGVLTNGKPEESIKPTQQETDIDIIPVKDSEEKTESVLETVAETSSTASDTKENIEVTEPETQIDLEATEVSEKKSKLATEQVPQTQPENGQAQENISKSDPEKRILLKLGSEKSFDLLEGLQEATGCTPSTLLLANIYRVSNSEGESQLVLKQGKTQQKISTFVEGDIIIKAISRLRKFPEVQEIFKLSPDKIDEQLRVKVEANGSVNG